MENYSSLLISGKQFSSRLMVGTGKYKSTQDMVECLSNSEATKTFLKAIENYENESDEAKAIINNALGFSYAAQNEFKKAIKHYNSAIKSLPEYPIALNNLASAQQRLLEYDLAYETYQKVLVIDPKNKTAIKKSKELEKRNNYKPYKGIKDKGF